MTYASPAAIVKSSVARGLREFLLTWLVASVTSSLAIPGLFTAPPGDAAFLILVAAIVFALPTALALFSLYRIVRFAFTH
jgi:hypothetical protein